MLSLKVSLRSRCLAGMFKSAGQAEDVNAFTHNEDSKKTTITCG